MNNKAQKVRTEDKLTKENIQQFLAQNFPTFKHNTALKIKQYTGGASNLTYLLQWQSNSIILRTSPKAANIKSAHDMQREYKVLKMLEPHFHYAPKPLVFCEDENIIGRSFYLMEKIEGNIVRRDFQSTYSPQQASTLCKNLIDIQLKLHAIDTKQTDIKQLGKAQGYINRQVTGWSERYNKALLKDSLTAKDLMQWLLSNQPTEAKSSIIHNDYKLDNVVISAQDPTKIIAVLDWEMTTIGCPLMDLGCSLAYWIEANDNAHMQSIRMMPTNHKGMWTRQQIIQYYAKKSQLNLNNFNFYYVFGLFRLGVIVQQIYKRYATGATKNPKFKTFGSLAKILINQAEKNL